ncbi:MAG: type II secretion system protein GspD [Planctomycetes bacterium]|nr:type II secretion system protein GspD [Planctomycetota bacterium]
MKNGHRFSALLALAVIATATIFAAPARAQEGPDSSQPITIDFVQKDIHTVMHYIALRSGLQISVEGSVKVELTVMYRDVDPKEAIRSLCKSNKLDYIEDGKFIIIKARPQDTKLANVVKGEQPGRYNVMFELHPLVQAINEVASITESDAYVPAAPPEDLEQPGGSGGFFPGGGSGGGSGIEEKIRERKVSMYMREASPREIMERLAALGGMKIKIVERDAGDGTKRMGFEFEYPVRKKDGEAIDPIDPEGQPLVRKEWTLPGLNMDDLKNEVKNLLSPIGKMAIEKSTSFIVVYDVQDPYLTRVSEFLDPLVPLSVAKAEEDAKKAFDPIVVREYRVMREVSTGTSTTGATQLHAQLQPLMSEDGRVVPNPDRNSIIIWERQSRMPMIDALMASLDTAPEQVLITSKLIEVTLDEYLGYGLELFTSHGAASLNDGIFTGGSQDTSNTVGGMFGQPTGFDPFFATFTNPRIDIRLEFLANEGKVKTLSQPSQMVSNRKQARIEVGQEIPYLESTGSTGGSTTATVAFKEVSIVMDVTPSVLEGGLIRLQVIVTVREVVGNVAIEGTNTPVLSKRESKTDVFIHDGETLVMGGLMRERERQDENGIPFLKDIPFLGYLFKSWNKTTNKTDLLFFVRPQIVSQGGTTRPGEAPEIARDVRPLIYEDGDETKANIRPNRFRKLGLEAKPKHYNPTTRPKSSADVNPGA